MRVFLLRHGSAEELETGSSDAERNLSSLGQTETTNVGNYLASTGLRFLHVRTSPFVRAKQTAENIVRAIESGKIEISDMLQPGVEAVALANWLDELATNATDAILVVGHEPSLSKAINQLLHIEEDVLTIEPATLVELSFVSDGLERKVRLAGLIRSDCLPGTPGNLNPAIL